MEKRCYYEILEIDKETSQADIKKAYRNLAMKHHPDRNQGDKASEELFKEASEAYEVLSDPQKRQVYDMYGHQGLSGRGFHGFDRTEDVFSSFGDLFEDFFGGFGGRSASRARGGADLREDIKISFHESATGCERDVEITTQVGCTECTGSGQEPGSGRTQCTSCGGSGQINQRQGFFVLQTTCPTCRGAGSKIDKPCSDCRGHGVVREKKSLNVKVPAGIQDGMRLIVRSEGDVGSNGGPAGDLYVFVHVEPDKNFERYEDDIYCRVDISFPQAALGDKITVPTLAGENEVKIPAGTNTGDQVRLPKLGFPNVHNAKQKGDQVLQFVVKTPQKLSKKQQELLKELAKLDG